MADNGLSFTIPSEQGQPITITLERMASSHGLKLVVCQFFGESDNAPVRLYDDNTTLLLTKEEAQKSDTLVVDPGPCAGRVEIGMLVKLRTPRGVEDAEGGPFHPVFTGSSDNSITCEIRDDVQLIGRLNVRFG